MLDPFLARPQYLVAVSLVGVGLFVAVDDPDRIKKLLGLNVFQTGVFLFLVAAAFRPGARSPLVDGPGPFVDPLPQVLVLTAIVVGVAVNAVALALLSRLPARDTPRNDTRHD